MIRLAIFMSAGLLLGGALASLGLYIRQGDPGACDTLRELARQGPMLPADGPIPIAPERRR